MKLIALLDNIVQFYDWGSPEASPELLGKQNPTGKPWAELWMGAHLKAPSRVNHEGQWQPLIEQVRKFVLKPGGYAGS